MPTHWLLRAAAYFPVALLPVAGSPLLLVTSGSLNDQVGEFDPSTGAYLGEFATPQTGYTGFSAIAAAANGDVYLAEAAGGLDTDIYRQSAAGGSPSFFVRVPSTQVPDMTIGANGDLFVLYLTGGSQPTGLISEYSTATATVVGQTYATSDHAESLAVGANGAIYAGDSSGIETYHVTSVNHAPISFPGVAHGLYVGANGYVWGTASPTALDPNVTSGLYSCTNCQNGGLNLVMNGPSGADPNHGTLGGVILSLDGTRVLVASETAGTILAFDSTTGAYDGIFANAGPVTDPQRFALLDATTSTVPEPRAMTMLAAAVVAFAVVRAKRR